MKKSLSSLDLNLLLCLQLLMQERSVTKTAKRMNVTPSAVSKSLSKLRTWFDDPLFVNTPLGLSPTPLMVSMEQSLAEWMQMGNQLLDKPHHESPRGLKFDLAAETPLVMIMFNALSQQIYLRYPQATIKIRNWDYDSLDAIIRGEVDIGFTGRESHPRSRELLSLLPLSIDHEVLFSDRLASGYVKIIPHCRKSGIWTPFCAIRTSALAGSKAIHGRWMKSCKKWDAHAISRYVCPVLSNRCLWPRSRITRSLLLMTNTRVHHAVQQIDQQVDEDNHRRHQQYAAHALPDSRGVAVR